VGWPRVQAVGAAMGAVVGSHKALHWARAIIIGTPGSFWGPDIKRKIASGIEPIWPLIDNWPWYLHNEGASAAPRAMSEFGHKNGTCPSRAHQGKLIGGKGGRPPPPIRKSETD